MPSEKKHRKGATKHKDEDNTYKKLSCDRNPKHSGCNGQWIHFPKKDRQGRVEWEVRWAPCRENDAVEFMKEEHGYTYNPRSRHENDSKPEKKYSKKKHPALYNFFRGVPGASSKHNSSKVGSERHNTQARAVGHSLNEHLQRPPPTPAETPAERDTSGARILAMFQAETVAREDEKREKGQRVDAWMAEQEGPARAMPSSQWPVPPGPMSSSQSTYTSSITSMDPTPVTSMPPHVTLDGDHQRRPRPRSSNKDKPEWEPQPSMTAKPPRTMPAEMASPMGMVMPPRMPPTQGPTDGNYQRHQPAPASHSSHGQGPRPSAARPSPAPAIAPVPAAYPPPALPDGQRPKRVRNKSNRKPEAEVAEAPLPPAAIVPPPGSMRESMAILAGGTMSVPRTRGFRGYGDGVHAAGPSDMAQPRPPPPPMNTTMPARAPAQNTPLPLAAQLGPETLRPPMIHLFPTEPLGNRETAAATAGEAPGPRAIPSRPSRRAPPPNAGPAMPPKPRMEPPPMSMPPFPGTGPGTPVPFSPSISPPPLAPTPPMPDGALDSD